MYLHRNTNKPGKGRFLLVLSLSTVTAAAVAAPLALQAVQNDADRGPSSNPTTTTASVGSDEDPSLPPHESVRELTSPSTRAGKGNIGPGSGSAESSGIGSEPAASSTSSSASRPPSAPQTPATVTTTTAEPPTTTTTTIQATTTTVVASSTTVLPSTPSTDAGSATTLGTDTGG